MKVLLSSIILSKSECCNDSPTSNSHLDSLNTLINNAHNNICLKLYTSWRFIRDLWKIKSSKQSPLVSLSSVNNSNSATVIKRVGHPGCALTHVGIFVSSLKLTLSVHRTFSVTSKRFKKKAVGHTETLRFCNRSRSRNKLDQAEIH